jgi:hypothetical protein
MFYYMEVTNKFQDLTKWYNEDPDNRYFSFQEPNTVLQGYHNITSILDTPITHTFKKKITPVFDFNSYRDECILEIKIEHKTANFMITPSDDSLTLEVHGQREGTIGKYP